MNKLYKAVVAFTGVKLFALLILVVIGLNPVKAAGAPVAMQILPTSTMDNIVVRGMVSYAKLPKYIELTSLQGGPIMIQPLRWKFCGLKFCANIPMKGFNHGSITFSAMRGIDDKAPWMWATWSADSIHWEIERASNYKFDGSTLIKYNAQFEQPQEITVELKNGTKEVLKPLCSVSIATTASQCVWSYKYPTLIKQWSRVPGPVFAANIAVDNAWWWIVEFEGFETYTTMTRK